MVRPSFTRRELQCRGTAAFNMSDEFLDELQRLRNALNEPMIVNSGCRSAEYNATIGGHPRSLHICDVPQHDGQVGALAVDVAIPDGHYRGRLYTAAWQFGWSVGEGRGFLHLDRRVMVGLPQTTFGYGS